MKRAWWVLGTTAALACGGRSVSRAVDEAATGDLGGSSSGGAAAEAGVGAGPSGGAGAVGGTGATGGGVVGGTGATGGQERPPLVPPTSRCAGAQLERSTTASLAFTEDGTELALGQSYEPVKLFSVPGLEERMTLAGYGRVAVSARGVAAMGAGPDAGHNVLLQDLRAGRVFPTLAADTVFSLSFSDDGETLAVGSYGYTAVYRTSDGALLDRYEGFVNGMTIALSPDARYLAGRDAYLNELSYWDRTTGARSSEPVPKTPAFTPGGHRIALFGVGALEFRDVEGFTATETLEGNQTRRVAFARDADVMMSAGTRIEYRRLSTLEILGSVVGRDSEFHAIAISPNGRFAASSDGFGSVTLYCVPAGS